MVAKSRAKKSQAKNDTTQVELSDKLSKSLKQYCPKPGNVVLQRSNHGQFANNIEAASNATQVVPRQPQNAPPVKGCPLLALPGELRNKIYGYVYDMERTVVIRPNGPLHRGHPRSPSFIGRSTPIKAQKVLHIRTKLTPTAEKTLQCHRKPGGKLLPFKDIQWKTSAMGLLLTSKTLGEEAAGFLYSRCVFFFEDTARINAFIKTINPKNLSHVQKIKLFIQAYGIPYLTDDAQWEHKHTDAWGAALLNVAENMPNITQLEVNMHFPNIPGQLSRAFRTSHPSACQHGWECDARSLLTIRPLSRLRKLEKFKVQTGSNLLTCSRDMSLVLDTYRPHFEVHEISHISDQEQDIIFQHNKMQADGLHLALNRAMNKIIRGEGVEGGACFSELVTVFKAWQKWAQDPVGNSLRAVTVALPPVNPVPVLTSPATLALNPVYTTPSGIRNALLRTMPGQELKAASAKRKTPKPHIRHAPAAATSKPTLPVTAITAATQTSVKHSPQTAAAQLPLQSKSKARGNKPAQTSTDVSIVSAPIASSSTANSAQTPTTQYSMECNKPKPHHKKFKTWSAPKTPAQPSAITTQATQHRKRKPKPRPARAASPVPSEPALWGEPTDLPPAPAAWGASLEMNVYVPQKRTAWGTSPETNTPAVPTPVVQTSSVKCLTIKNTPRPSNKSKANKRKPGPTEAGAPRKQTPNI